MIGLVRLASYTYNYTKVQTEPGGMKVNDKLHSSVRNSVVKRVGTS